MNTNEEIWKSIPGYEGHYEASNYGKIRGLDRETTRRGMPALYKGKILTPFLKNNKRPTLGITINRVAKTVYIHRLVALAFIPNPFNKPEVNHLDGDTLNNRADNLEWCTKAENMSHAAINKLMPHGEKHSKAKLTRGQVLEIRHIFKLNPTRISTLAKDYNVSRGAIYGIVNNINWTK